MRVRTWVLVLAAGLGPFVGEASAAPPARIVSLAPSITETLFAIGAGPRVVGVTDYCRYPPEAEKAARVGGYLTPSYETLVALRPDLVVVLPEHDDLRPRLEALGLAVLRVDHRTVEGIVDGVRTLGARCGGEGAEALAAELAAGLDAVDKSMAQRPRPRVLITLGRPGGAFRSVLGGGPGGLHDDLITRSGGVNVLADAPVPYPSLSAEGLLRLDPDVVVELVPRREDRERARAEWSALGSLRAVRRGRVVVFNHDFLSVPGPRLVRFVAELARALHPAEAAR